LSATSFMALNNGVKVFTVIGSIWGLGGRAPSGVVAWGGLVATLAGGMVYAREMSRAGGAAAARAAEEQEEAKKTK
jgi:hypothetical protein